MVPEGVRARTERLVQAGRVEEAWGYLWEALRARPLDLDGVGSIVEMTWLSWFRDRRGLAREWIRRCRREARPLGAAVRAGFQAAEVLALRLGGRQRAARRLSARIRWDLLDEKPWAVNVRIGGLLLERRLDAIFRVLRETRAVFRDPVDLAQRLLLLSQYHGVLQCELHRSASLARAALRHLARSPRLLGRHLELLARGRLARYYVNCGLFRETEAEYLHIIATAKALRSSLEVRWRTMSLAWLYAFTGRPAEARKTLATCPPRALRTRGERDEAARWHIMAALAARTEGAYEEAREHLEEAERLLRGTQTLTHLGTLHWGWGELFRDRSSREEDYRRALEHYARAEEYFSLPREHQKQSLALLQVARGYLHVKWGDGRRALEACLKAIELARAGPWVFLEWRALLLLSFVLLEKGVDNAKIYEQVLRQLGVINDPVVLFKVIANLYMYSWELDESLELTDHHLKQLQKLRDSIDPDLYARLYAKYVTQRVFHRAFGLRFERDEPEW